MFYLDGFLGLLTIIKRNSNKNRILKPLFTSYNSDNASFFFELKKFAIVLKQNLFNF